MNVLALYLNGKLVSRYTVSESFTQDVLSDLHFGPKPVLCPADQQVWDDAAHHDYDEALVYEDFDRVPF